VKNEPTAQSNSEWEFESPEPRKRLGGIGTESHNAFNVYQHFDFGIPTDFVSKSEFDNYNEDGDFEYDAYNPNDPPTYESQAAYLKRHNLLTKSEEKRLKDSDFEPEKVIITAEDAE
jgi:hypothetical protein